MRIALGKLRAIQRKVATEVNTEDALNKKDIKRIAGFDLAYFNNKTICVGVVLDAKTLEVVEEKHSITKTVMNYIPGYLAFREGPAIIQTYYDLEYEPEVLMVEGHGIAHPLCCGLATYVGVELAKPTIGVAKKIFVGETDAQGNLVVDDEKRGLLVKTKEYAKPVFVSPGHMISIATAADIVKNCIRPPHKLPEPIHRAHRHSKQLKREIEEKVEVKV